MSVNHVKVDYEACYMKNSLKFVHCNVRDDEIVCYAKKRFF